MARQGGGVDVMDERKVDQINKREQCAARHVRDG